MNINIGDVFLDRDNYRIKCIAISACGHYQGESSGHRFFADHDHIERFYVKLETPAPTPAPAPAPSLMSVPFLGVSVEVLLGEDNLFGASTVHTEEVLTADELDAVADRLKVLSATIRRLDAVVGAK